MIDVIFETGGETTVKTNSSVSAEPQLIISRDGPIGTRLRK
jgi:hypothetical protein